MSNNLNKEALLEKYSTSWKSLNEYAHLSPIVGLGAVTVKQVEEYCGVDHDTFQVARQRLKKQLDMLGMYTDVARHVGTVVPGAEKTESYGYMLPLEDGSVTEIPCGHYTYFTPEAVALMNGELSDAVQISADQAGQEPSAKANNDTDTMAVKSVPFLGTELMAARDSDGQIWAGVRWMCDGLGLSHGQRQAQIKKIKTDTVLSKGWSKLILPTNGGKQEVFCLKLDFVPIWLVKISITPTMKREHPELASTLKKYRLFAKDMLANAFIAEVSDAFLPTCKDYPSALRAMADNYEKNIRLAKGGKDLFSSNAMLTNAEAYLEGNYAG